MKLKELLKNINYESINLTEDIEVTSIAIRDSECVSGSAFFCIQGRTTSGSFYVNNAKKNGAVVIISSEIVKDCDIPQIITANVRDALGKACSNFYDNPQKKLRTIAVVGTNGKTTVCELIAQILNKAGYKCGKIGTLGAQYGETYINTGFTTPDPPALYKILSDMYNGGMQYVCMELSAHAIYYKKADFKFDIAIFTNCTPEHLDFFETFEEYRETKLSAFYSKNAKVAVVNGDDLLGKEITCIRNKGVMSYGITDPADVFAIDVKQTDSGMDFIINLFDMLYEIKNPLLGIFNVYNLLATATALALCGLKTEDIAYYLCDIKPINGRMEKVCDKIKIYIDYAHTPDGLKNALLTINNIKEDKRLICVFGCGGNRDKTKRAKMGEISGEFADFTVITSDNPRYEDEDEIIAQIEAGIRSKTREYISIRDRERAIEYAIQMANYGDYILIAGKGAEEVQERMGVFKKFSDKKVACKLVKSKYD